MMQKRTVCRSSTNRAYVTPVSLSAPSVQWAATTRRMTAQRARQVPLVLANTASAGETAADAVKADIWERFASQASGEWEGITATFSPSGSPQQLPEYYVPEAFREWRVELYDWQSQCSSYASVTPEGGYQYRSTLRRLMPTVGCEADAIAFTEEHSGGGSDNVGSSSSSSSSSSIGEVMAVRSDGSYNIGPAGWPSATDESVTALQIEHCFMIPMQQQPEQQQQQQQQRQRVKVVQKFKRNWLRDGAWEFTAVELHRERYDGPYTGRRDLAGCGGGQSPIAQLPPLTSLGGSWIPAPAPEGREGFGEILAIGGSDTSNNSSRNSVQLVDRSIYRESIIQKLNDYNVISAIQKKGGRLFYVTMLPLNAWSRVLTTKEGHVLKSEAGVLFDSSRQMVSVRQYVSAQKLPRALTGGIEAAMLQLENPLRPEALVEAAMIDKAGLLDADLMIQQKSLFRE